MASSLFNPRAMIKPPTSMPGALKAIRSDMAIMFWICCRSLVSLVTREPVENSSRSAKEKPWIFLKRSLLKSAEKLTDALAAK